jgi:S-DNA-T family DNA segregation ATPase FtsK/SpoIIIE
MFTAQINKMNEVLNGLNIKAACTDYQEHRHFAFYDLKLDPGTMVSKIERRTREIGLAISSRTTPMVKLLQSRGLVRIQVAISDADLFPIYDLFDGVSIPSHEESLVPFILGETDEGKKMELDLSRHPHTLIAGGTGSGKSVLLHTIIANAGILRMSGSRDIQVYLSDPKQVEFNVYEGVKSLAPVIAYDYDQTISMLKFIENKMNSRYELLASEGYSSVEDCPDTFSTDIVIIDEVSDLMIQDKKSKRFETLVVKLAQKCRAAGIYLVLATQRPSVDVLTGLIKANFPARISCKVSSRVDSQVILDSTGAECLLGRGDAILQSPVNDKTRFQVAYTNAKKFISLYSRYDMTIPYNVFVEPTDVEDQSKKGSNSRHAIFVPSA